MFVEPGAFRRSRDCDSSGAAFTFPGLLLGAGGKGCFQQRDVLWVVETRDRTLPLVSAGPQDDVTDVFLHDLAPLRS